MVKQKKYIHL